MTLLGVIADRERAWAWTDSEVYSRSGAAAGHQAKMSVNPAATVVCVCAGWGSLAAEADTLVRRSLTYDDLVDAMPDHLRRATMKASSRWQPGDGDELFCQTVLLAGFSGRDDRTIAYVFRGRSFFEPAIVTRFSVPPVEDFDSLNPRHPAELLPGARQQLARFRDSYPAAAGGPLVVALIQRGSVTAGPVADLAPTMCEEILPCS